MGTPKKTDSIKLLEPALFETHQLDSESEIEVISPPSTFGSLPFPDAKITEDSFDARPINPPAQATGSPLSERNEEEDEQALSDTDVDIEASDDTEEASPRSRCRTQ